MTNNIFLPQNAVWNSEIFGVEEAVLGRGGGGKQWRKQSLCDVLEKVQDGAPSY